VKDGVENKLQQAQEKTQDTKAWEVILKSGMLKGIFMMALSIPLGGFGFIPLMGLSRTIKTSVKLSPFLYSRCRARIQVRRSSNHITTNNLGTSPETGTHLQPKQRSDLEAEKGNIDFDENIPTVATLPNINNNPAVNKRRELASKFTSIELEQKFEEWIGDLGQDERFSDYKERFKEIQQKYKELGVQKAEEETIQIIKNALGDSDNANYRFLNMFGVEFYDPNFILLGIKPGSRVKVRTNTLKQDIFESSMSTLDKMSELKQVFDTQEDLSLFAISDGQLIYIPVSSETNLADWLDKNHISIDSDILVLPISGISGPVNNVLQKITQTEGLIGAKLSNVERRLIETYWMLSNGKLYRDNPTLWSSNPNVPHYQLFRDELANILLKYNIIPSFSVKSLQAVIGNHFRDMLTYMRKDPSHDRFKATPSNPDLDKLYGKIKTEVVYKYGNYKDKQNTILFEIDRLFDFQYKIFGLESQNRFFRLASQTYNSWVSLLQKYGIASITGISNLGTFMGYTSTGVISTTLERLFTGQTIKPTLSNVRNYINEICSRSGLNSLEMNKLRRDLNIISEPYIKLIEAAEHSFPTIEVAIDKLRSTFPNSQKLDLISEIVKILGINNLPPATISTILFDDINYLLDNFLSHYARTTKSAPVEVRPQPWILNWIKYNVRECDENVFFGIGYRDNNLITKIKEEIIIKIDKWINSNPFDVRYVRFFNPEIGNMVSDVKNYIWYAFAIYTKNPKITFENIMGIVRGGVILHYAGNLNQEALKLIIRELDKAISNERDLFKINLYKNTISIIRSYMEIYAEFKKESDFKYSYRPTQQSLRNLFEKDQYIRAYLIVNLLSRDLGFDPLFFDSLDKELFDKSTSEMYAIHHKDRARSWSIYIRDLFITSNRYHRLYDSSHISLHDTNVLLEGMHKLIELGSDRIRSGNGNWEITESDISTVFTQIGGGTEYRLSDGRTVLEWWQHGSLTGKQVNTGKDFMDRLGTFNKRIKYLVDSGQDYEKLINNFYPKNAPDWISKCKIQMDTYEWMSNNRENQLHFYVHLEDIDLIRENWGFWIP